MRFRLRSMPWGSACIALLAAVSIRSQEVAPDKPSRPIVEVWGASVSAGFTDPKPRADGEPNSTVKLAVALQGLWDDGAVEIRDRSDVTTFVRPLAAQSVHVERGLAEPPALVVAIDFMFWFGYGGVRGDENAVRLENQAKGLALLDKVQVPILVGDYPDMHGADPRMLSPRQIPSVETLRALNERLRAWAADRPNVRIFPLADFVVRTKGPGVTVPFAGRDVVLGRDALLQGDGLHATRLGIALLAEGIGTELRAMLPMDAPVLPLRRTYVELVHVVDASDEFDELAEVGKTPAAAGGGK